MTKHLRILLIALFAMVCMGGYSQTYVEAVIYSTGFETDEGFAASNDYQKSQTLGPEGKEWYINYGTVSTNNKITDSNSLQMRYYPAKNVTPYAQMNFSVDGVNVVKFKAKGGGSGNIKIEYSTDDGNTWLGEKEYAITKNIQEISYEFSEMVLDNVRIKITSLLTITGTKGNIATIIDDFQLVSKTLSSKTATTTSFVGLSGTGVVLNQGKQSDGTNFTGYTAAEEDEVAGTITYATSGDGVATVDATTGKVTVNADVYGTTTITATFTPTDADAYLGSTASYTITNANIDSYSVAALRTDINDGKLEVDDNHFIKLLLTNAKVVYRWTNSSQELCFIREGEGDNASAVCLYNSGVGITQSKVLNGTYTGIIYNYNGMLCLTKCNATSSADLEISGGTIKADPIEISTDDVAKHVCDLVSVKGANVTESGSNIVVSNGSGDGTVFYNKFASNTASMKTPYAGANVDLTSAIVITFKNGDADLICELAPTEKYTVIYNLSEDDATSAVGAHQDVPVSLKRTFVKDEWNTLCLPFALTADQLKKLLGDDVQVRTLSAVDGNKLTFAEATALDAETPCLVKLSTINEDNTYTIEGVELVSTDDGRKKTTGDIIFAGIYAQTDVTTEATGTPLFLGTGNKFYQAKADTKMQAFRAYFDVTTTTDPESLKAVIDGETTGIDTINGGAVVGNGRVYNLNGQYVGTSLQKLQPGVYVQNGKKVVIR